MRLIELMQFTHASDTRGRKKPLFRPLMFVSHFAPGEPHETSRRQRGVETACSGISLTAARQQYQEARSGVTFCVSCAGAVVQNVVHCCVSRRRFSNGLPRFCALPAHAIGGPFDSGGARQSFKNWSSSRLFASGSLSRS
jgi:hypothetical protein